MRIGASQRSRHEQYAATATSRRLLDRFDECTADAGTASIAVDNKCSKLTDGLLALERGRDVEETNSHDAAAVFGNEEIVAGVLQQWQPSGDGVAVGRIAELCQEVGNGLAVADPRSAEREDHEAKTRIERACWVKS